MTSHFAANVSAMVPDTIKAALPPGTLSQLASNPQALVDPNATSQLEETFSHLGPQGAQMAEEFLHVLREALAKAIGDVFVIALVAIALAFVATLFLKEVPLRRSHRVDTTE
ncbi:MAG: hypothetical protein NTU41_06725, partial [Chloroflexi bacterium]|nr:hypothetical protein [Chloroflexota bacterium]